MLNDVWQVTEARFSRAITDVATELGGEDLAQQVIQKANQDDTAWPAVEALQLLKDNFPDAHVRVLERFTALAEAERSRQRDAVIGPRPIRGMGKTILRGIDTLTSSFDLNRRRR